MRQPLVMRMLRDAVMFLAGGVERIDVDDGIGEGWQVVQESMPHVRRNGMSLLNRQVGLDGDIQFRMEPIPQPPGTHLRHLPNLGRVLNGVSDPGNRHFQYLS